jgi:hypothetical protein
LSVVRTEQAKTDHTDNTTKRVFPTALDARAVTLCMQRAVLPTFLDGLHWGAQRLQEAR